jgi:hypothetical protein
MEMSAFTSSPLSPEKGPVYICRLFEDVVSTSDYLASNVWVVVNWNEFASEK